MEGERQGEEWRNAERLNAKVEVGQTFNHIQADPKRGSVPTARVVVGNRQERNSVEGSQFQVCTQ